MKGIKELIISRTLELEGGFTDNPNDRGNYTPSGELKGTKYGISAKSYPDLDIKNLSFKEAFNIYKKDYWDNIIKEHYPDEIKPMMFDMAVNHGIVGANKILQRSVGVIDDGIIGSITNKAIKDKSSLEMLVVERCIYFAKVTKNRPSNLTFLVGWNNRVKEMILFTREILS